jgi:hypothetical protein
MKAHTEGPQQDNVRNKQNEKERKLTRNIRSNISANKLTKTKSAKEKLTIVTQDEYKHKIQNLIPDSQITMINNGPIQHYEKS